MAIQANVTTEKGDVMLIDAPVALDGIAKLESFTTDTDGENDDKFFFKEFRYSLDQGKTYTDWQELTQGNVDGIEFIADRGILIQYRYTHQGTETGDLTFNSVSLLGEFKKSLVGIIRKLDLRFYPKGRAFWFPENSNKVKLKNALAASEDRAVSAAFAVLNSILPDNEFFTETDADEWEERLGIPNGSALDLEDRKRNIRRKLRFPGRVAARQHFRYIQSQLREAGFDVYVHENRFDTGGGIYEALSYSQVAGVSGLAVHSDQIQHGQIQHGTSPEVIIANSVEEQPDQGFNLHGNLGRTFFIGGQTPGTTADVDASREKEFRQLILRLKPAHTVGYLLINYG